MRMIKYLAFGGGLVCSIVLRRKRVIKLFQQCIRRLLFGKEFIEKQERVLEHAEDEWLRHNNYYAWVIKHTERRRVNRGEKE